MAEHQRIIARMQARIGAILGLRAAAAFLSAWLLVWAAAVLLLRGVFFVPRGPLVWGLAGVALAAVVGIVVGVRRRPSRDTIRALLDGHWRCGGLLMAAGDADLVDWPVQVPAAGIPSVRWHGGRQCGILLCCAVLLLVSFLVPARFLTAGGSQRLLVGEEVEKLAKKIELLKEEKILPPERAKSLEVAVEQLEREASGNDPAKTWEAIDHLEQSIAKASAEAAEETAHGAERKARAEELAAALDKARDQMSPDQLNQAMALLARDVQRAAEENNLTQPDLLDEYKGAAGDGGLSKEQLAELAKSLGKCKECDLSKLGKLAAARLIDPKMLQEIEEACEIDPDALADLLAECDSSLALSQCLAQCNKPGRGGVTRGRGDAALTWNDGANRDDVTFKEKVLPPGAAASLRESRLQGVSVGDPTVSDSAETSAGGALDVSHAGRGSARTQVLLPEHKKIVARYFNREPAAKAKTPASP